MATSIPYEELLFCTCFYKGYGEDVRFEIVGLSTDDTFVDLKALNGGKGNLDKISVNEIFGVRRTQKAKRYLKKKLRNERT